MLKKFIGFTDFCCHNGIPSEKLDEFTRRAIEIREGLKAIQKAREPQDDDMPLCPECQKELYITVKNKRCLNEECKASDLFRNDGMLASSKCRFCRNYYEKKRPYCCPYCFEAALELAKEEGWIPTDTETIRHIRKNNGRKI